MTVLRIVTIVALSIIGPIGAILNGFVLIAIIKNKRLHSVTSILYSHLAVCDLIASTVGGVLAILMYSTKEFVFCRCSMTLILIGYATSIGTLTLISYDRYTYFNSPLHYFQKITAKKILVYLACLWIVVIGFAVPMVTNVGFASRHHEGKRNRRNCILPRLIKREFLVSMVVTFWFIPTLLLIMLNIEILRMATRQYRNIQNTLRRTYPRNASSNNRNRKFLWNKKAIKTTLTIVVTNVLCTLPYMLVIFIEVICRYCYPYKKIKYAYSLHLLNFLTTLLNPVIYTSTNHELRKAMMKLLSSVCIAFKRRDSLRKNSKNKGTTYIVSFDSVFRYDVSIASNVTLDRNDLWEIKSRRTTTGSSVTSVISKSTTESSLCSDYKGNGEFIAEHYSKCSTFIETVSEERCKNGAAIRLPLTLTATSNTIINSKQYLEEVPNIHVISQVREDHQLTSFDTSSTDNDESKPAENLKRKKRNVSFYMETDNE